MDFLHCSVKIIGRSSGRSAVAAAAYRAGEKLANERDALVHDYRAKGGVEHAQIMLPEGAPASFADRSALWNAVEGAEKQKNAQLAREVEIALPRELSLQERIEFVQSYVQENFVVRGMCADIALHSGHARTEGGSLVQNNPHAHIMLSMRPIEGEGFGAKSKKEYILDEEGNRTKTKSGEWRSRKVASTDWDSRESLISWRESLADRINAEMERLGLSERVDHRSYKEQGLDREPTVHLGPAAAQMEARGIKTERGGINRGIRGRNRIAEQLREEIRGLEAEREGAYRQRDQGQPSLPSAEDIAKRMIDAKAEYVRIDGQIARQHAQQSAHVGDAKRAEAERQGLMQKIASVRRLEAAAVSIEAERKALGFFAFRAKRDLKREIARTGVALREARGQLGQIGGPKGAYERAEALSREAEKASGLAKALVRHARRELGRERKVALDKGEMDL